MGKDFIPIVVNGLNLENTYNKLFSGTYEIIEASEEKYFFRIPQLKEIQEIEVGQNGTNESILRLSNGYAVINRTINFKELV